MSTCDRSVRGVADPWWRSAQRFGHAPVARGRERRFRGAALPTFLLVRGTFPGRGHDVRGGRRDCFPGRAPGTVVLRRRRPRGAGAGSARHPGRPDRRPGPGGLLGRVPPPAAAAHRGPPRARAPRAARPAAARPAGAGAAHHGPDAARHGGRAGGRPGRAAVRWAARPRAPGRAVGLRFGRRAPRLGYAATRARPGCAAAVPANHAARAGPRCRAVGRRRRRRAPRLAARAQRRPHPASRRARAAARAPEHPDRPARSVFPRCRAPFPRPGRILRPGRAAGPPRRAGGGP